MNELIYQRTISSRDRFHKFLAHSRNSPSKAMTMMQKEKINQKKATFEDLTEHHRFWSETSYKPYTDPKDYIPGVNPKKYFIDQLNSSGKFLTDTAISDIDKTITVDELTTAIKSSPFKSSAGIDGVPYEIYKNAHPEFVKHLIFLLNEFYKNPQSMPDWIGTSTITLLYKKGDQSDPANYRPISLLPTLWKLLSGVLTNRINKYLREIIGSDQVGFVKTRNIEVALHTIDSVIQQFPQLR